MMSRLDWNGMEFAHPHFLWLLLLVPVLIYFYWVRQRHQHPAFAVSTLQPVQHLKPGLRIRLLPWLPLLRLLAFISLVIAMARPRQSNVNESVNSDGIDIVMSLDISGSMLAEDFSPNRIEAAKKVAQDFISHRPTDRIGLVIFSGESYTLCPLTTDQSILQFQLKNIRSGMLEDGTAIGMGLATAVDRLRMSKAKSRIIILLTDGVNNAGLIDPITALEIAKAYKIRVYTIGVGSEGSAPYPVQDEYGRTTMKQMPVQIDETLMQKISRETGGKYYRAKNNNALANIYKEIDRLEKTRIEISSFKHYAERFTPFALLAIFLLFLESILRYTYFRRL